MKGGLPEENGNWHANQKREGGGGLKATNYAACIIRFMLDEKGSLLRISGWRRTMGFIGYIRFLYKGVSLKRGPLFAPSHLSVNVAARSCQKI